MDCSGCSTGLPGVPGVPDTKPEKRDSGKPGVIPSDGCEKVSEIF